MIGGAFVVPVVAAVIHLDGEAAQYRAFDRSVDRASVRKHGSVAGPFKHRIVWLGRLLQLLVFEQRAHTGRKVLQQLVTLCDGVAVGESGGVWHCGARGQRIERSLRYIGCLLYTSDAADEEDSVD